MTRLVLTQEWDKTFPKSDKVEHKKVTFHNRYGIELAADMYVPRSFAGAQNDKQAQDVKLPAIAVSGPFGAVKEQSSGLYAQHMAERGFVTLAFDPSFTGESGGEPRRKKEGSGIGLSLSRQIMRNHNGTIELLRSNAQQTVFELRFR